jgi:hypothetical protein
VCAYDFRHFCSGRVSRPRNLSTDQAKQLSESRAVPRG